MGIKESIEGVVDSARLVGTVAGCAVSAAALGATLIAGEVKDKIQDNFDEKKAERIAKEELKKEIACDNQEAFNSAIERGQEKITVVGELYDEIRNAAIETERAQGRNVLKTVGLTLGGFILPGILGVFSHGAAIISLLPANSKDATKQYLVEVDELQKKIFFTKK